MARSPVPPKLRPEYLTLEDEDSLVKFDPCVSPPLSFPSLPTISLIIRFGDSSPPTPASDPSKQRHPQFSPVLTSVSSSLKAKDGETDIKSVTLLNREKERERDLENERVAEGMRLLLASRDRVLTLAEQRVSSIVFLLAYMDSILI